jgi:flagellar biosynthesis protein FlhF
MSIETFRAPTMREALALVRQRLGGNAVLLGSREIESRAGLLGGRRIEVEVTAAVSSAASPSPAAEQLWSLQADDRRDASPGPVETPSRLPLHDGAALSNVALPEGMFQAFTWLLDAGLDESHARSLLFEAQEQGAVEPLESRLLQCVEAQLRCTGAITIEPGRRRVVALAGPTGVGKTTTIAKLAAEMHFSGRCRIGLITLDTFRAGAVDQLRTYANVIGLPMHTASSSSELQTALDDFSNCDLVLIDTAGRGPRDEARIQELRDVLALAPIDELHLVVSVSSSQRSLIAAVERFRLLRPTNVLLTKLDEAPGLGSIYSAARCIDLPISYFTTGQDVPDDIEPAKADRTARLILGLEHLQSPRRMQA